MPSRKNNKLKVHFSSKTDNWATPQAFFDECSTKYGPFDLDVCASGKNAKCPWFFSLKHGIDGLKQPWTTVEGKLADVKCWMNPPYGDPEHPCKKKCNKKRCKKRRRCNRKYKPGIADWVKKASEESAKGCKVVSLLPARTDTRWFHDYIYNHQRVELVFLKGRLKFGNSKNSAPFPSMLAIFYPTHII